MDPITELAAVAEALRLEQEEDFRLHEDMLRRQSVARRREAGLTWFPLKVNETGYGLGAYPFIVVEQPGEPRRHQFQNAAPVALFSDAEGSRGERIQGTIGYVDDRRMKIIFYLDDLPDWVEDGRLGVDLLFDGRSYEEMWKALNELINTRTPRLRELLDTVLGAREPRFRKATVPLSPRLNASQQEALESMVCAEDLALVHGPPGTGKTTTLVEGIRAFVGEGEQVLVCAPSNAAVDYLTRSLDAAGVRTVRVGNLARIGEDTTDFSLDAVLERDKDYRRVRELKKKAAELRRVGGKYRRQFGKEEAEQRKLIFREARELNREAREMEDYLIGRILDQAQAITCTLIGSAHEYLRGRSFPVVVIDEAGQATEPATWVPVLRAGRVVMAGDPFQLPPTVKSAEAERKGLAVTLLEKAIARSPRVSLLRTQYRMNAQIMAFSSAWFYKGLLEAHESVEHWQVEGLPDVVEWIDTAGCGFAEAEGEEGESRVNPEEAHLLLRHFSRMREMAAEPFTAGIISPYRAQVDLLTGLFGGMPGVVVNTVDSFQGQERDVICLSLVRSNPSGEIGFLRDYRRMNVAMTRARKKLVIAGDSATLANDPFYSALLDHMEKTGAWRSAWEWMT